MHQVANVEALHPLFLQSLHSKGRPEMNLELLLVPQTLKLIESVKRYPHFLLLGYPVPEVLLPAPVCHLTHRLKFMLDSVQF